MTGRSHCQPIAGDDQQAPFSTVVTAIEIYSKTLFLIQTIVFRIVLSHLSHLGLLAIVEHLLAAQEERLLVDVTG